jgi:hypothetical protein
MTTIAFEHRRAGDSLIALTAWGLLAGALVQIVLGIPLASLQAQNPPPMMIPVPNAISHLLLMAGVAGLARSGAVGQGWLAIASLALTLLGLAVMVVAEASWLAQVGVAESLYGTATLAVMLGLLLTGAAVVRARCWTGWHRYTPLVCGLYIPLVLLPSFALPGLAMNYAIGLWGVCWLLLGLALRAETI